MKRRIPEAWVAAALLVALAAFLILSVAMPLWALLSKAFENAQGQFVGLANFRTYFSTPALLVPVYNSLFVALTASLLTLALALPYAYALARTRIWLKTLFFALALLPLFAPSLLSAISLIYLFGNQGLLRSFFSKEFSIYGADGIILAQVVATFPHAVLLLLAALRLSDQRLYEAAEALGASRLRRFFTITLPGIRYGLVSAFFVVFTLVITDFGIAKVIGGQFRVLATDAYRQIVGQQNFEMGAVVGLILLVPAVLAFAADRFFQARQVALVSARAVAYFPPRNTLRDSVLFGFCLAMGLALAGMLGVAIWASFIQYWPYNLQLTLRHYDFPAVDPGGWEPYFTSLRLALLVALIGTAIVVPGAYLIEKIRALSWLRNAAHFLAMIPMAVPGLVFGLGTVFFINNPANPLTIFYASMPLLVVSTIGHFYTVAHIAATTAFKQLDREFESVSLALKVPFWRLFTRVSAPISLPAILDVATYLFVNALTTLSAVIFLYGPSTRLASVAIIHMDEAGATASAAAMATCLVLTAMAAKGVQIGLEYGVFRRLQRWRLR